MTRLVSSYWAQMGAMGPEKRPLRGPAEFSRSANWGPSAPKGSLCGPGWHPRSANGVPSTSQRATSPQRATSKRSIQNTDIKVVKYLIRLSIYYVSHRGARINSSHWAPMGTFGAEKKGRFAALFSFHRAPMDGLRPKKKAASRPFLASTGY